MIATGHNLFLHHSYISGGMRRREREMLRLFLKEHCGKLGINEGAAGAVFCGIGHASPLLPPIRRSGACLRPKRRKLLVMSSTCYQVGSTHALFVVPDL